MIRIATSLMLVFTLLLGVSVAWAQDDADCFDCHGDPDFTVELDGKEISLFVDPDTYATSKHADMGCISCHGDIDDLPHAEQLEPVDCSMCHEDAVDDFHASLHGQALECATCHTEHAIVSPDSVDFLTLCSDCHMDDAHLFDESTHGKAALHGEERAPTCVACHTGHNVLAPDDPNSSVYTKNIADLCAKCHGDVSEEYKHSLHGEALAHDKFLAPNCTTCHRRHNILPPTNENSTTYVMNIPSLCGECHKEGTKVSELESVDEHHILENYSQSIHGDGLFRRGLIVTAVCTDCHTSHNILPHEHTESSINRNNIANTCMACHRQIEDVHVKVIKGELWEKRPHEIPACVDCHSPHEIRRVYYEQTSYPNEMCMKCHSDPEIHKVVDGERVSLFVDENKLEHSVHKENSCIKCHVNISEENNPICLDSGKVDCSICHAVQVENYEISIHGQYYAEDDPAAPYCTDCHGDHDTQSRYDQNSPTFSLNIPDLCGECHREGEEVATRREGHNPGTINNYAMGIHGKGLMQSGLTVTATCVDCHTSHFELPADDPRSTVFHDNIATTCGTCHVGIYEDFRQSIHSPMLSDVGKDLPVCNDCHQSHTTVGVEAVGFRQQILNQCGTCHEEVTNTYFDTFHGKVSKLGSAQTARCHDCHGSHNILPPTNPSSTLSRANIVGTCQTCHPNSNRKFVGYLTHATHHNKEKYPYLFYAFWFMTILLVGTFTFFGLHTLLWLPRAFREKIRIGMKPGPHEGPYYERFDGFSRLLHVLVIISFLSLAITGMIIKFSGVGAFQAISNFLGGYEVTGFIHRVAAIITFGYFFLHIGYLIHKLRTKNITIKEMLVGERSMVPNMKDVVEFGQTVKWFLGMGPRPSYGRWTYWEKFDYFAVFWGVAIIGTSGLILWFPEFFTNVFHLPGWLINVATIIHSDEALLATGFIFTIHFFNTHFRPDKFPMDPVIFTGRVPVDEWKEDRPREYAFLLKSRKVKKSLRDEPSQMLGVIARIFGFTALFLGLATVVLIIYAMIFLYQ